MDSLTGYPPKGWVAPFGDLGITGRSPLPRAFRSVPRPSSPLGAKASTRCPSRARPRPAPRPRCARPEVRDQRSEIRPGRSASAPCLLTSGALRKHRPYQGFPRRICIPMPGHDRSDRARPEGPAAHSCHARFTVTTRFTMSKRHAATPPCRAAARRSRPGRLRRAPPSIAPTPVGGPGPTRTADLTLIRRAL